LGSGIGNSQKEELEEVAAYYLLQIFLKQKRRPYEILVRRENLAIALQPLAKQLDVTIRQIPSLSSIDKAYKELQRNMKGGPPIYRMRN
jgi:hypothetical protein